MRLDLSGWYINRIGLENKVVDLARFEIRQRIREEDLEKQYDEFIDKLETIEDYFQDQSVFRKVRKEASVEKRPKLVARTPKYPLLVLNRKRLNLKDKYFYIGRCITLGSKVEGSEGERSLSSEVQKYVERKFSEYPEYEGLIEIPNDRILAESKAATFHEGLHYIIHRYQDETGRRFIGDADWLDGKGRQIAEKFAHEVVVETLTDKLLVDDKEALFESRWPLYEINSWGDKTIRTSSLLFKMGIIASAILVSPYIFPSIIIPGRIEAAVRERYKESKRDEVLKPVEYPKFKI